LLPYGDTQKASKYQQAALAEELIALELRRQGWIIPWRNFRRRGFELDIVATKQKTLVAVEVKFRTQRPRTMVEMRNLLSARKLRALERGAKYAYAKLGGKYDTIRIDLAVVYPDQSKNLAIDYYVNVLG
jgi:putative endonuclease